MAKIPESEIERLKTEISLERLVEGAGVKLKKRGGDRIGHCPFHDDKTPSLLLVLARIYGIVWGHVVRAAMLSAL